MKKTDLNLVEMIEAKERLRKERIGRLAAVFQTLPMLDVPPVRRLKLAAQPRLPVKAESAVEVSGAEAAVSRKIAEANRILDEAERKIGRIEEHLEEQILQEAENSSPAIQAIEADCIECKQLIAEMDNIEDTIKEVGGSRDAEAVVLKEMKATLVDEIAALQAKIRDLQEGVAKLDVELDELYCGAYHEKLQNLEENLQQKLEKLTQNEAAIASSLVFEVALNEHKVHEYLRKIKREFKQIREAAGKADRLVARSRKRITGSDGDDDCACDKAAARVQDVLKRIAFIKSAYLNKTDY